MSATMKETADYLAKELHETQAELNQAEEVNDRQGRLIAFYEQHIKDCRERFEVISTQLEPHVDARIGLVSNAWCVAMQGIKLANDALDDAPTIQPPSVTKE